jgi:hypothetical protein
MGDVSSDIQQIVARHQRPMQDAIDRAPRKTTGRGALLWAVDGESFFGSGTPASDTDLAVVAFLCGVSKASDYPNGMNARAILDRERATIAKLRAEYGLGFRREMKALLQANAERVARAFAGPFRADS